MRRHQYLSNAKLGALLLTLGLALGCPGDDPPTAETASPASDGGEPAAPAAEDTLAAAADRGERIYQNVCIACHNANPSVDGSLGPAVAGSSYELIEARVIHGTYPEGYTPKRPGGAMPQFPFLKDKIGDLEAYLARAADASS